MIFLISYIQIYNNLDKKNGVHETCKMIYMKIKKIKIYLINYVIVTFVYSSN